MFLRCSSILFRQATTSRQSLRSVSRVSWLYQPEQQQQQLPSTSNVDGQLDKTADTKRKRRPQPAHVASTSNVVESTIPSLFIAVLPQLRRLNSHFDPAIVFKAEHIERREDPSFQLMTQEELDQLMDNLRRDAAKRMRIVPLLNPRSTEKVIISEDPELAYHDLSTFIFTDISAGADDRTREIVVREPTGLLREALAAERGRVNRAYFARDYAEVELPKLFFDPYLSEALTRGDHRHVMDWACHMMEPDDPTFVRVSTTVYRHADTNRQHAQLWSSRHWAHMMFYCALNSCCDNSLLYLADQKRLSDMADLVRVYAAIHNNTLLLGASSDDKLLVNQFARIVSPQNLALAGVLQKMDQQELSSMKARR